jgi:hypothetical protein
MDNPACKPFDEFLPELMKGRPATLYSIGHVDIPWKRPDGYTLSHFSYDPLPALKVHPYAGLTHLLEKKMTVCGDGASLRSGLPTDLSDIATEFALLVLGPANGRPPQVVARILGGPTGIEVQYQPEAEKYLPI